MASLLILALMLSEPGPRPEQADSLLKVKLRNSALDDPLRKAKTTPSSIPADSGAIAESHRQAGYFQAQVAWRRLKDAVEFDVCPGPRTMVG